MMFTERDTYWMQQAIQLANQASQEDEVPVGAVLVLDDEIVGVGYNRPISHQDPTAHAEIIAMREGAAKLGNYRLLNTTLYVTLEPCLMCAGAMVHARIDRLVYGALDGKAGAVASMMQALDQPFLNHRVKHAGGLLADQCGGLLSEFFRNKRLRAASGHTCS